MTPSRGDVATGTTSAVRYATPFPREQARPGACRRRRLGDDRGHAGRGYSQSIQHGRIFAPETSGWQGAIDNDFRGRAICSIGGIICDDATEALYFVAFTDADGNALDGSNRYTLRFEKGGMPQVSEFWPLTMCDPAHNLVDNPINC